MKQHEHKCPKCKITFLCRGKACSGDGADEKLKSDPEDSGDVYCQFCWDNLSD